MLGIHCDTTNIYQAKPCKGIDLQRGATQSNTKRTNTRRSSNDKSQPQHQAQAQTKREGHQEENTKEKPNAAWGREGNPWLAGAGAEAWNWNLGWPGQGLSLAEEDKRQE